jgi:hypothetical protein
VDIEDDIKLVEIARLVRVYFTGLLDSGFTTEEAMFLTAGFQQMWFRAVVIEVEDDDGES